jgi:HEPN domain-containing protein
MSAEKNRGEASRWLETSRGDLETARILKAAGRWAHACFHAQQSVEKALKALWYAKDLDPWGHSAQRLVDDLATASAETYRGIADLSIQAAEIDRFYIPTRYPNGLPDLTPEKAFFESDAARAVDLAERIIERVARIAVT